MQKQTKKIEWKDYEDLIHKIYTELDPTARVKKNDFIHGQLTKTDRQIDISIRSKIAGTNILMIVQAKMLKKPADVNVVGEFNSVIRDIRADRGILICHSGFTKAAKEYAKSLKIDLYTAHDASVENWQTKIEVPVIKKSIRVSLTIQHSVIPMGNLIATGLHIPFPEDSFNAFLKAWEEESIPKSVGQHEFLFQPVDFDYDKEFITYKSKIIYKVEERHHFKFFIPEDYRGLKNYLTDNFNPSYISFRESIPYLNDGTWKYIKNPQEVSINTHHLHIEIMDIGFLNKKIMKCEWNEWEKRTRKFSGQKKSILGSYTHQLLSF